MSRVPDDERPTDPQGLGDRRRLIDQSSARHDDEKTAETCPACDGKGEIVFREETGSTYCSSFLKCDFCEQTGFVTPVKASRWRIR